MSGFDFHPFTKGAGKASLALHSTTVQAVAEEYTTRWGARSRVRRHLHRRRERLEACEGTDGEVRARCRLECIPDHAAVQV
jgi:hypothetical protein